MAKKSLTEQDIRTKFITPAIIKAGWDNLTQIREEYRLTDGKIIVRGQLHSRGAFKRADYLLFFKTHIPLAVVEAKDNSHAPGAGMQQAIEYAKMVNLPFAYSSNGDCFIEHDFTRQGGAIEREIPLNEFPSPTELWRRYLAHRGFNADQEKLVAQDYHYTRESKEPRYYQLNAINRVVEAIASRQNRILLVMATGTGKTFTAFQIIYRLWKSGVKKRILFLADRNILIDQTRSNDFQPFQKVLTKIQNRDIDKSFEIYLALYQAITGTTEEKNIYKEFSRDFFDLIVVDECHRGSADQEGNWHDILKYFHKATQIGLTATPKETRDVSNSDYFGDPLYTYSLKQGIEDGFLAPYRVVRVSLDKDEGWRPIGGQKDKHGEEIEDRIYNQRDYDKNLVLEQRNQTVAKKLAEFMAHTNRMDKTIVFCEDIDHAERMRREIINLNGDLVAKNDKYCMKITGDDADGKMQLEPFIDPASPYPVVVTTSRLMTTKLKSQLMESLEGRR